MAKRKMTNKEIAANMDIDQLKLIVFNVETIVQQLLAVEAPDQNQIEVLRDQVKESDLTVYIPTFKKDKGLLPRKMFEARKTLVKLYMYAKFKNLKQ